HSQHLGNRQSGEVKGGMKTRGDQRPGDRHAERVERGSNRMAKMTGPMAMTQMLVRLTGLISVILGVLLWTGRALALIPQHMFIGVVFVLSLWVLAALAARAGVSSHFIVTVVLWGVLVLVLGLMQRQMLVGDAHWVIQVLHLLI